MLEYNKTLVCVQTDVLFKQVIPLMLACTLPFVSSNDMMEKVLWKKGSDRRCKCL